MDTLLREARLDLHLIRTHTLQPEWYKRLKVFLLLGFLLGYARAFGRRRMLVFLAVFFSLSAVVHLVYRRQTHTWQQSWLDFTPAALSRPSQPQRIGPYYYLAVAANAILAVLVSQVWPPRPR
jgi:hypothetical protein